MILFFSSMVLRLFFYLKYFLPFAFLQPKKKKKNSTAAVSVVIAAKNEADNLENFLPKIVSQSHPNFEVIVVDDHSMDHSWQVLQQMQKTTSRLSIFQMKGEKGGKKNALLFGISKAKNYCLLFTDADCYPASERWIAEMLAHVEEKKIVLGYGRYEKSSGLLNKLVRYDTLFTGIRYLSFAAAGRPYMGVGRNLLYTKDIFKASQAFQDHAHIPFGDDDLLVNEMGNAQNSIICFRAASHTISLPASCWKEFFLQKLRHLKAGKFYKTGDKLHLGIEGLSRAVFLISSGLLLLLGKWMLLPFILMIALLHHFTLYQASAKLKDRDLVKFIFILEPLHFLFLSTCAAFSLFKKEIIWK